MIKQTKVALASIGLLGFSIGIQNTDANAATITIDFAIPSTISTEIFSGKVTITNDFTSNVSNSSAGLVVDSLSFDVDVGVVYTYAPNNGFLAIDGALPNFSNTGNDFSVAISNLLTNPTVFAGGVRQMGLGGFLFSGLYVAIDGVPIANSLAAPPSAVPLPAALPLLLGALGIFGFAGWRRKRVATA